MLDASRLEHAIGIWNSDPTTGLLGDILSFSIDSALRPRVIDLLRDDPSIVKASTATQANFIEQLLAPEASDLAVIDPGELRSSLSICNPSIRREVSNLRKILSANPANPLALLDLAQFQITSGDTERAERSLKTALSLSPDNRIALRTLARLYVHKRENERAHDLIGRHARTGTDPWLMATEIALAEVAGKGSRFAKKGFQFAREKRASNAHISELAGALGGAELQAGNLKRAREMFRLALLAPNDNVVAQAVTHQKMLGINLDAPVQRKAIMSAHEAQTLLAWTQLDIKEAESQALAWHDEEPFSSRPLQFLTTIYAAQRDFASAMILSRRGLIADPNEPSLLSNLAYVLAGAGNMVEAERVLRRLLALKLPKYNGVALATAGLMVMKQGDWKMGDDLYEAAMRAFRERRDYVNEALCSVYFARSAADTGHPDRSAILLRAEDLFRRYPSPDASVVLTTLNPEVELSAPIPEQRRLSQWVFDPKTETLVQVHRLTEPGAPPLIIKN